jgi:hypothetical protein
MMKAAASRGAWMALCLCVYATVASAQVVPAPWTSIDIGTPALAGSATYANGAFRIDAAGDGMKGASDQFHFVYQAVTGDVDLRGRLDSLAAAHTSSSAGVMIRSNLTANAAHGFALVSVGKGLSFQRRSSDGATTAQSSSTAAPMPQWVRLMRSGTRVTMLASSDGVKWTWIASETIALGATAYVGVAVASYQARVRTTAVISSASAVSSTLPAGQATADIGNPAIVGTSAFTTGQFTISAAGTGITGTADQFHFVYRPVTGNLEIVTRVESIGAANTWSKAGVMIRESLAPGSRHVAAIVSANMGFAFQRRIDAGALSEQFAGGAGAAPGWVRLVRTGTLFAAFRSVDGTTWTPMNSMSSMSSAILAMPATVYVGIAVSSHNAKAATAVVVDSLRITQNLPPSVTVTDPVDGATFVAPATVTLTASASDPDGAIEWVEFYLNSTLVGHLLSAPLSTTLSGLAAGVYQVNAVASDNLGAATVSPAATFTVWVDAVPPRVVAFMASADHATLVQRYVLEIYASGATPGTSVPVASTDLGKPIPTATGEITLDLQAFLQALPPGMYLASVIAVGEGGIGRATPATFGR